MLVTVSDHIIQMRALRNRKDKKANEGTKG